MAKKPKEPTYGELINMRTALSMQKKAIKTKFPNDKVKVTQTLPDGTKLSLKDVEARIAAFEARSGKAKAKKPLTASERAFVKNQKEKAKATKRTGVYPNTAN